MFNKDILKVLNASIVVFTLCTCQIGQHQDHKCDFLYYENLSSAFLEGDRPI